jgi:hypothetical protein
MFPKNLKDLKHLDPNQNHNNTALSTSFSLSYTKTNKLITAVYMVTDIMDINEPLRNKLRTLMVSILSDTYNISDKTTAKIKEIMSFLDVAVAVNLMSDMNSSILKKEFALLDQAIKDSLNKAHIPHNVVNIFDLFKEELPPSTLVAEDNNFSIGHKNSTRIGVQKGSTLMQAIKDKTSNLVNKNLAQNDTDNFFLIKQKRREDVLNIIKIFPEGVTIKDINLKINSGRNGEKIYSEKTLQRELVSMIKDGVLDKTGEKRWSKYFIKNVL